MGSAVFSAVRGAGTPPHVEQCRITGEGGLPQLPVHVVVQFADPHAELLSRAHLRGHRTKCAGKVVATVLAWVEVLYGGDEGTGGFLVPIVWYLGVVRGDRVQLSRRGDTSGSMEARRASARTSVQLCRPSTSRSGGQSTSSEVLACFVAEPIMAWKASLRDLHADSLQSPPLADIVMAQVRVDKSAVCRQPPWKVRGVGACVALSLFSWAPPCSSWPPRR